jgi:hypothetical protein
MERKPEMVGMVFSSKMFMPSNTIDNTNHPDYKQSLHDSGSVPYINGHLLLHNLQTLCSKIFKQARMAELKMIWVMVKWLGIPVAVLSWFTNLDNSKGWITTIFGIPALLMYAYFMYYKAKEKAEVTRKMRLENDAMEFELNLKKYAK